MAGVGPLASAGETSTTEGKPRWPAPENPPALRPGRTRVATHACRTSRLKRAELVEINQDRLESGKPRRNRWPDDHSLGWDREWRPRQLGQDEDGAALLVESRGRAGVRSITTG